MKLPARWLLLLLPLAALLLLVIAPLLRLAWEGWGGAVAQAPAQAFQPWRLWQDDYLRGRVLWSFAQAAITCVSALMLGLPVAWVLARLDFWGRQGVLRLLMLPFVVPTLVAAMGVLALWGPRGVLSSWLGVNLQDTPWLLLYGNLFFNLCLVVRAGVDALGQVSAQRVAAARTLGATPWRAFWRVEWPAILPWLASSLCLVFLYCFTGFGLALVLGGQRYATMEVEIYTLVAHELKLAEASALALWMLLLTGGVALAYAAIEKRLATPARMDPMARQRPERAAQWLAPHAAGGRFVAHHQSRALHKTLVRSGARLHAGHAVVAFSQYAGCASVAAGKNAERCDRACQSQTGRDQLRIRRHRHRHAHVG